MNSMNSLNCTSPRLTIKKKKGKGRQGWKGVSVGEEWGEKMEWEEWKPTSDNEVGG